MTNQQKEQAWQELSKLHKLYWATAKRLEKIKPTMFAYEFFWQDIERHNYPQNPISTLSAHDKGHLIGNFWGMVSEKMYQAGILK